MRTFYHDSKNNYREGNIIIFLECCIDNYLQILDNKAEIEKIFLKDDLWIIENGETFLNPNIDSDYYSILIKTNHKLVIQSVITLCSFLESLINEIGRVELGSGYFKDNIDSLSILAKWEIVLKLIYGKGLNKSLKYYQDFNNLIKVRNSLVHYKTKIVDINDMTPLDYYEKSLIDSINSLPLLLNDFEKLNKKKYIISIIEIKSQFFRIK